MPTDIWVTSLKTDLDGIAQVPWGWKVIHVHDLTSYAGVTSVRVVLARDEGASPVKEAIECR